MSSFEDSVKKFYTEEGHKALKKKLESLVDFYNMKSVNDYPIEKVMFYGFKKCSIETRSELLGRIKELAQLTGAKIQREVEIIKGSEEFKKSILKIHFQEIDYGT